MQRDVPPRGVYDGWPSSYTATAVAIGVALASYYAAWWIDVVGYGGGARSVGHGFAKDRRSASPPLGRRP